MRQAITVLFLSGITAVAGCGAPESTETAPGDATSPPVRGVTDAEIVLGTHSDLSGPIAIWGVGVVNGMRMRFDAVNAAGGLHGRQIRLIVEDTAYQVPRAISAANKLIERDGIFAMVGAVGTQTNNAVLDQQFRAGVPNLFPSSGSRDMVEPFRKLMISQIGLYYEEMRAGVKYFIEEIGKTTPCAIYHDSDYGMEIYEGVRDQAAEMGIEIGETSAHRPTESEFTAAVLRLRNAGCDLVMMGTVHRDTILILETARKIGWEDVAFVGNEAAFGRVIAEQKTGSGEGYYAFAPVAIIYEDDEMTPEQRDWFDRYNERFGEIPGLPAMVGKRAADLTVLGLELAGRDLTRKGLMEALESLAEYEDIFGNVLTFGPDDHKGVDSSTLSQVQNGRWVKLQTSISY
ncbi:MAG: ABC transporter substrate-binding protein [Gammaproteobacteria bacterium]|nr:ABC transporter substrate-binding protein [Gammaproteobacteria bacterium]